MPEAVRPVTVMLHSHPSKRSAAGPNPDEGSTDDMPSASRLRRPGGAEPMPAIASWLPETAPAPAQASGAGPGIRTPSR